MLVWRRKERPANFDEPRPYAGSRRLRNPNIVCPRFNGVKASGLA